MRPRIDCITLIGYPIEPGNPHVRDSTLSNITYTHVNIIRYSGVLEPGIIVFYNYRYLRPCIEHLHIRVTLLNKLNH
jgi:hypothetical protein